MAQTATATTWTDERVDTLAALVTVTEQQLADRERAEAGLAADTPRVHELIALVFGGDEPSVENYLSTHEPIAA